MIRKILAVVVSVTVLMSLNAEDLSSRIYLGSIPSVSADGSFFVFEWCDRIWRASSSGGEAVALTDGMTRDIRPILSPDSKRMTFLSNRNGGWKLFEMGLADTPGLRQGDVRQISFHSEDVILRGYTSDSTKMLANVNYDYSLDDKSPFHGFNRVVLLPIDRRGREELLFDAPARDPALSSDGSKLLFVDRGDGSEPSYKKRIPSHKKSSFARIWLYDIKTKKFSKLVDRSSDSRFPIWAPDGDGFYFMNDEDGVRNVYYRSLESGKERKVTNFRDDHVFAPTLSRDGRTMIIRKGFDFWRLDPTQKEPIPERIQLIPAGNMPASGKIRRRWYTTAWNNNVAGCIDFTNEGKEIAFTAGGDLWVMDTTLRQPVRIHASSLTHERDCKFSKDGSTLYYLSDRGEGVDIWRAVRADPKRAWWENTDFVCTRLTRDDVYREKLSIAPDDKHLAWVNRTGKIFFADTNAVVLSVSQVKTTSCAVYSWSPDSRWVAGSFKDAYGNFDVWIVPAFVKNDDGTPPPAPYNISRHQKYDGFPAWSSDGKIIAFSGVRAKNNDASTIFYAYLNPKDEELENPCEKTIRDAIEKTTPNKKDKESDKKAGAGKTENVKTEIGFDDLFERVRETDIRGEKPCFGYNTRKLAFHANGNVHVITIPNNLKPSKVLSKAGDIIKWIKVGKDDKFLRTIGSQPAHGDQIFGFKACQETNVEDYQELAFLSGWALLRDMFCDPNMHGANWPAVKEKYRLAARHAPAWSVFNRVMQMMIGELDASHQGFWISDTAKKEWDIAPSRQSWEDVTAHIGARYDSSHTNDGWKVSDVVPRSPADRGEEGLLRGDIVMSIDGRKLKPSMDVSEVMNTPMPHKFRVEYIRNGTNKVLFADAVTYSKIRELMRNESIRSMRKLVRKSGDFGYINISAMDNRSLNDFMDSIFAEGFGKEGLIIDVRYNGGGYIADRVLDVLCGPSHSRALIRGDADEGYLLSYWGRPLLPSLPIVVLCNWRSSSNAEIFTHAIKTLKRGKIVGVQTAGSVIATQNIPLLDMGTIRKSYIGWFTADGTDMEFNGAKPDIEVDITPEDIVKGRDTQLDAAIRVLKKESANASKLPPLKFAK